MLRLQAFAILSQCLVLTDAGFKDLHCHANESVSSRHWIVHHDVMCMQAEGEAACLLHPCVAADYVSTRFLGTLMLTLSSMTICQFSVIKSCSVKQCAC